MTDEIVIVAGPTDLTAAEIGWMVRPILERAGATRAWLFGSHARGDADAWSDVDLIVELETTVPFVDRGNLLSGLFDVIPAGLDLLVYTPDEIERAMKKDRGLFAIVRDEGVLIYERS